jgi:hypothetical protein
MGARRRGKMGTQLQLDTLADRFGIEASYRDAAGENTKNQSRDKAPAFCAIEELFEGSKINEVGEIFGRERGERSEWADRSESAAG